jgi:hypothetical protein
MRGGLLTWGAFIVVMIVLCIIAASAIGVDGGVLIAVAAVTAIIAVAAVTAGLR